MNVALCLSGELRRVKDFFPAIKKNILDPYQPDVFISTWDMPEGIATSRVNTKRDPNEVASLEEALEMYDPLGTYVQKYNIDVKKHLQSIGKTTTDNLLCMVFHIMKSITLATERCLITGKQYDCIIRHRFDYACDIKLEDYEMTAINIPDEHGYGGYQDQFAFGNLNAMTSYALWFPNISNQENEFARTKGLPTNNNNTPGMPWHPESCLKRYLDRTNYTINLIKGLNIAYPWIPKEMIEELYD